MGSTIRNLRRHIIYKGSNCVDIDVVSDVELDRLKKMGKVDCIKEVSNYVKDSFGISKPVFRKKYFYKN